MSEGLRALVVASAPLDDMMLLGVLAEAELVIAADGGAAPLLAVDCTPDLVVGDLDSLPTDALAELECREVPIERHPRDKDETDLELALEAARARGARELVILGALGARWDHSLANILLLAAPRFSGLSLRILGDGQEIGVLHAGRTLEVTGVSGEILSLIPVGGDAVGITTKGLRFPLRGDTLRFSAPRGVSNEFTGGVATVSLTRGVLLVVRDY